MYPDHAWTEVLNELRVEIPTLCTGYYWGQEARANKEDGVCLNTAGPGSKLNLFKQDR